MVGNDKNLLFSCHCIAGLFSYNYEKSEITRFCSYGSQPIPAINSLNFDGNIVEIELLSVPDEVIRIEDARQLVPCFEWCKLVDPHNRNGCKMEKYENMSLDLES
jgi:hypothetical protein